MEPNQTLRFEIQSTYTKSLLIEAYRVSMRKSYVIYTLVLTILFTVLAAYNFVKFFLMHHFMNGLLGLECLLGAALFILLFAYMPYRLGKRQYKANATLYQGQDVRSHTQFYEDTFQNTNLLSGGVLQWAYPQITKCTETKNLFVLVIDRTVMLAIEKGHFTLGATTSFKKFLGEKCPNAKLKFRVSCSLF